MRLPMQIGGRSRLKPSAPQVIAMEEWDGLAKLHLTEQDIKCECRTGNVECPISNFEYSERRGREMEKGKGKEKEKEKE